MAERQQPPHDACGLQYGLFDLVQALPGLMPRRQLGAGQRGVARDRRQHVVDVVRNPRGKLADDLHLLGLIQLLLQAPLLGHVARDRQDRIRLGALPPRRLG